MTYYTTNLYLHYVLYCLVYEFYTIILFILQTSTE